MPNTMKNLLIFLFLSIFIISCKQDPCEDKICLNSGICIDGTCQCEGGYSGERCQDYDECFQTNCLNGGTCLNGDCDCPSGYIGTNCETVDPCLTLNCLNGGDCVSGACACPPGFGGVDCSVVLDPTKMRITKITIDDFPATRPDGTNWDYVGGPDIMASVSSDSCSLNEYTTGYLNDCLKGNTYPINMNILIEDLNVYQSICIWDWDSPDPDYMGGLTILPSFYDNWPTTILLQNSNIDLYMQLTISWEY